MIVPSIDLMQGRAVQLVGGEGQEVVSADPFEKMEQFSAIGEVAVVDLDAARGVGNNTRVIRELCRMGRVRVGGGIRDVRSGVEWLDAGANKIIIGTAASEPFLADLPSERVIIALDSRDDQVLSHGWERETGRNLIDSIQRFRGRCGGFLVTFVEMEGRLQGTDFERAAEVVHLAGEAKVTIAGGISSGREVADLDRIGADAQVGMALYTGQLDLAEGLTAPMTSDREDGLWPTVVTDTHGVALGLAWSNQASVREALAGGRGVYHSRKRGLWAKGDTSGARQKLVSIDLDCDRDALRFVVEQSGSGFCHREQVTCWGDDRGISRLAKRLMTIADNDVPGSNTALLLRDPGLLSSKLVEEATELGEADGTQDVANEAADLIYFTLVRAAAAGVDLADVERILDRRELQVSRRPMTSKKA